MNSSEKKTLEGLAEYVLDLSKGDGTFDEAKEAIENYFIGY